MTQSENPTEVVVEDLLLTDAFLVKGRIEGKFTRLFKVLEGYERQFLIVDSAMMIDLRLGEVVRTPRVHINLSELLLVHELVDGSGDYYQKQLSQEARPEKGIRVRAFYRGGVNLELAGSIRPQAYDRQGLDRRFFVMEDCVLRGLDLSVAPELSIIEKLPYAIVNKSRISYLYDFSGLRTP
jgi:hypothetical protein